MGRGGVVLKNLFCAGLWILLKFPPGLIPVFQSSASPSNCGGLVSSWMSAYCTDTGLSAGMQLG